MSLSIESSPHLNKNPEYPHPLHRIRRALGGLALCASIGVAGGIIGFMNDPIETQIGPHPASVTASFDGMTVFNFGMLGKLRNESGNNLGLGAEIEILPSIQQIPGTDEPLLQGGSEIAAPYIDLFSEESFDSTNRDIVEKLKERFGLYFGKGFAGSVVTLALYRKYKSKNNITNQLESSKKLTILIALSSIIAPSSGIQNSNADEMWNSVSVVFDGTPLEGFEIQGTLLNASLNKLAPEVIRLIKENDEFYAKAARNSRDAMPDNPFPDDSEDYITSLLISDVHCNIGMGKVIGSVINKANIELIIDAGDATVSGGEFEKICVSATYDDYNKNGDTKIVTVAGNHDSPEIEKAMKDSGAIVLNGKPQKVLDLEFLGLSDPRESIFGEETKLRNSKVSMESSGISLASVACKQNKPPIILVHDYHLADSVIEDSCSTTVLSGHYHKFKTTTKGSGLDRVTTIINGTSGGAGGAIAFGKLKNSATMVFVNLDPNTNSATSLRVLTIATDGTAKLGPVIEL
jgi:predicted phosphodiesterase